MHKKRIRNKGIKKTYNLIKFDILAAASIPLKVAFPKTLSKLLKFIFSINGFTKRDNKAVKKIAPKSV